MNNTIEMQASDSLDGLKFLVKAVTILTYSSVILNFLTGASLSPILNMAGQMSVLTHCFLVNQPYGPTTSAIVIEVMRLVSFDPLPLEFLVPWFG